MQSNNEFNKPFTTLLGWGQNFQGGGVNFLGNLPPRGGKFSGGVNFLLHRIECYYFDVPKYLYMA